MHKNERATPGTAWCRALTWSVQKVVLQVHSRAALPSPFGRESSPPLLIRLWPCQPLLAAHTALTAYPVRPRLLPVSCLPLTVLPYACLWMEKAQASIQCFISLRTFCPSLKPEQNPCMATCQNQVRWLVGAATISFRFHAFDQSYVCKIKSAEWHASLIQCRGHWHVCLCQRMPRRYRSEGAADPALQGMYTRTPIS